MSPSTDRRGRGALAVSVRIHALVYASVNLFLVAIWAVSGGGYFWPVWSILGWGIGLGCHAAPLLARSQRGRPDPALQVAHPPRREANTFSAVDEMAISVAAERPSLRPAAAP